MIIPRDSAPFDLHAQQVFDDNFAVFARLDNPNYVPVLFPMGRRFWNDRGLVVRSTNLLKTDYAEFRIARNLLLVEKARVSSKAFAIPSSFRQKDWIRYEVGEIVKTVNGSFFEALRTPVPKPKE